VGDFNGDVVGILPRAGNVDHTDASRFSFSIIFSTAIDGRTPNQHVLVRDYCARGATVTKTAARHAFAVVDVQLRNTMDVREQAE
jgi:hypothetical protein